MPEERRYTVDQVLDILWDCYRLRPECKPRPPGFADEKVRDYEDGTPFLWSTKNTILAFLENLATWFGFSAAEEEWGALADKRTKLRQVAEFIAARAPYREIRPLRILGSRCLDAGIFRELEHLTTQIAGEGIRIAPSTPLNEVLSKEQCGSLASRLAFFFPSIHLAENLWHRSRLETAAMLCLVAIILLVILAVGFAAVGWLLAGQDGAFAFAGLPALLALLLCPVCVLAALVAWLADLGRGPFRKDIQTYRDLVNVLKAQELRLAHA